MQPDLRVLKEHISPPSLPRLPRISRKCRETYGDGTVRETKFLGTKNIIISQFSDCSMHRAENLFSTGIHVRDVAVLRYPSISSSSVNRGEISDQKGPVIRDGVRPVPRLASRTITLRAPEPTRTGPDREESRFFTSVSPRPFALPSLCVLFREQDDYAFTI